MFASTEKVIGTSPGLIEALLLRIAKNPTASRRLPLLPSLPGARDGLATLAERVWILPDFNRVRIPILTISAIVPELPNPLPGRSGCA